MSRPRKDGADYFPHYANSGKTIFTLESMYGNDGYAFWFKLLEILCHTEGHCYRTDNQADWLFLVSKTKVSEETATSILKTLSELNAICPDLFTQGIIWCGNLVDNLRPVYVKRKADFPTKPAFLVQKPEQLGVSGAGNPQSRVEKSIGKKREKNPLSPDSDCEQEVKIPFEEIVEYLNTITKKCFRPTTKATASAIKARWREGFRIEDFKSVVDNRAGKWLQDEKMCEYLRPDTLFGTKFESYLNDTGPVSGQQTQPQEDKKCAGCGILVEFGCGDKTSESRACANYEQRK